MEHIIYLARETAASNPGVARRHRAGTLPTWDGMSAKTRVL